MIYQNCHLIQFKKLVKSDPGQCKSTLVLSFWLGISEICILCVVIHKTIKLNKIILDNKLNYIMKITLCNLSTNQHNGKSQIGRVHHVYVIIICKITRGNKGTYLPRSQSDDGKAEAIVKFDCRHSNHFIELIFVRWLVNS